MAWCDAWKEKDTHEKKKKITGLTTQEDRESLMLWQRLVKQEKYV